MAASSSSADVAASTSDFDGASMASQHVYKPHTCKVCNTSFGFFSHLAYIDKDTREFAVNSDTTLTKAVRRSEGTGFRNLAEQDSTVVLACWSCCSSFHNKTYAVFFGSDNKVKLTSEWSNKSKSTKRCAISNAKLNKVMSGLMRKKKRSGEVGTVSVRQAYTDLSSNEHLQRSTDWTYRFSANMSLLYGCDKCRVYPLRSNSWWRCTPNSDREGNTAQNGHWRCCNCIARWTWRKGGTTRLFVFERDDFDVYVAFIGETTDAIEAKINFLKACRILEHIDGRPITKDVLLAVIEHMNDEQDNRLMHMMGVKMFTANDPSGYVMTPYCEDQRLSMLRTGTTFRGLDLTALAEEPTTLTPQDSEKVVEMAAAFMDLDTFVPTEPAAKKARNALKTSLTVKAAKTILFKAAARL